MEGKAARAWQGRAGEPPTASASHSFGSRVAPVSAALADDNAENLLISTFLASGNQVRLVHARASLASPPPTSTGVPKPEPLAALTTKPVVVQHSHRAEIQHLAWAQAPDSTEGWLGSTDARGASVVSRFNVAGLTSAESGEVATPAGHAIHLPPGPGSGEWGWSGLAFGPPSGNGDGQPQLVRLNYFGSSLEWFEAERCLCKVHTLSGPTQAAFLPSSSSAGGSGASLVAVAEGHDVALWDPRASERNGCVQRVTVPGGPLHALSVGEGGPNAGAVAVGGAGRSVTLVDVRKWTPRNRATNLTKYEISSVHLSRVAAHVCYAGGVDSEVVSRNVSVKVAQKKETPEKMYGGGHYDGFRGDGRWVGLQCTPVVGLGAPEEALVGHTETGSLYVLLSPYAIQPSTN